MNEHSFIRSIHKKLPREIYHWKINDNFAGGVADAYYSGLAGDLWVEYKYVHLPKRGTSQVKIGLSNQQVEWLTSRFTEGRNVIVIVGSDEGCLLLNDPSEWSKGSITKDEFLASCMNKSIVIAHIINGVT